MNGHAPKMNNRTSRTGRWARSAIAVAIVATVGVGAGSAAQGQDIAPWRVCEATDMPLAVDLGGLAAPNVVLDADTSDALLHDVGSDPNCEIYDLPAGI